MKSRFLYLIASLPLVGGVVSCSKTDATPQATFFVQATKDATSWSATGTGTFSKSRQQFYVFGQLGNAAQSETLSLGFSLPASPQLTPVQALPARWNSFIGYDGVTNGYATADAASLPAIEITRLDTVAKVVEGRFNASLVRDKHWTSQTEVMRYTNGSFRVQYITNP